MAESDAKIRLTLDGQQFEQGAERIKRSTKGVGASIGQWANGMAKTMAWSVGLLGTLRQVAQAQAAARDAAAQMGESIKSAGQAEIALGRIRGITKEQTQSVMAAASGGVRSPEEVNAFAGKLAGVKGMDGNRAISAARLFATGMAAEEEEVSRRGVPEAEMARRTANLSESAKSAMAARRAAVMQEQRRAASTGTDEGLAYSLVSAAEKTRAQESPIASALGDAGNAVLSTLTLGLMDKQNAIATEQLKELRALRAVMFPKPSPGARGELTR